VAAVVVVAEELVVSAVAAVVVVVEELVVSAVAVGEVHSILQFAPLIARERQVRLTIILN